MWSLFGGNTELLGKERRLRMLDNKVLWIIFKTKKEEVTEGWRKLTQWTRVIFKKLIVIQLVTKFPALMEPEGLLNLVHKSPPLDPILGQMNPVHIIIRYFFKIHLILSSYLRLSLPNGFLPSGY
jgi:hypothetical protein